MNKAEFEKYIKSFWEWTSSQERSAESWLYSLEDWCAMMRAYERKKAREHAVQEGEAK